MTEAHDFATDVLATLHKRKVTLHGCLPSHLDLYPSGGVKIWFYGQRHGKPWKGGIELHPSDTESSIATGNSDALAQICEGIIDQNHFRFE